MFGKSFKSASCFPSALAASGLPARIVRPAERSPPFPAHSPSGPVSVLHSDSIIVHDCSIVQRMAAPDAEALVPHIRTILTAPGTDLATISAKNVRKQLAHLDRSSGISPDVTAEWLKEHKDAVDVVIARVFEEVSAEAGGASGNKRESEESDKYMNGDTPGAGEEEEEEKPKKAKSTKKSKARSTHEASDAELARQLSSELNGRSTRGTSAGAKPGAKPKRGAGGKKKSAETVDSDGEDASADGERPKKRRKGGGGGAKGGFAKPFLLR